MDEEMLVGGFGPVQSAHKGDDEDTFLEGDPRTAEDAPRRSVVTARPVWRDRPTAKRGSAESLAQPVETVLDHLPVSILAERSGSRSTELKVPTRGIEVSQLAKALAHVEVK